MSTMTSNADFLHVDHDVDHDGTDRVALQFTRAIRIVRTRGEAEAELDVKIGVRCRRGEMLGRASCRLQPRWYLDTATTPLRPRQLCIRMLTAVHG